MAFDYGVLAKYLVGRLTEEEFVRLMAWRSESDENEQLFADLLKLRIAKKYAECNKSDQIELALAAVNKQINKKSYRVRLRKIGSFVALLAVIFSLSFYGWEHYRASISFVSITVKPGDEIKKIRLEDGSIVWLNGGSTLQIPELFSSANRLVKLQGEAFFEIKKQPESPFRVLADKINIKVLGTSFNLKSDWLKHTVETVLVTGKVALENSDQKEIVHLSPGEKVTFDSKQNEYYIESVDVNTSTAWHLNQKTFENATLREIVNRLSILYGVNINLESKQLAERTYRCVINKDENLTDVLEILKFLAPIHYRIEGNEVFIYE